MMDAQAQLIHGRIWDLISDYADIRDELEDALCSIRFLYEELEFALDDIGGELDDIETHISSVSGSLKRFRCSGVSGNAHSDRKTTKGDLPWN